MTITKIVCPSAKIKTKCPYTMKPTRIIIHNTANDASAMAEVSYMLGNANECSFHFAVDDYRAVQGIELNRNTWNAGDGGNGKGNRKGISIEICYSKSGGSRWLKAVDNAAQLTAQLLKKYGWGIDKVTKHQDYNGKYCPHRILSEYGWKKFLSLVQSYLTPAKPAAKPTSSTTKDTVPSVQYRVRTGGKWLPEVKGLADYAGIANKSITDIAVKVSNGSVKYRVHVKGGKWLPYVTGYNIADGNNGYAGNGKAIDAVEIRYTPAKRAKTRKAKYRVSPCKGGYWPWQTNADKGKGMDGYAGAFGVSLDRLQITIE